MAFPGLSAQILGTIGLVLLSASTIGCTTVTNALFNKLTPDGFSDHIARLEVDATNFGDRLYVLEFDANGRLTNPFEVARAIQYIETRQKEEKPITRLLLLSFGWNYNRGEAVQAYVDYLHSYLKHVQKKLNGLSAAAIMKDYLVFGISWDSDAGGLKRFLTDLVPAPDVAGLVAAPFDAVAFPLTFWTKAALADRIGYGSLKDVIEVVIERAYRKPIPAPELYLIGHSFGARILSGFAQTRVGGGAQPDGVPVPCPFARLDTIRAAIFIQPALVAKNLPLQDVPSKSHADDPSDCPPATAPRLYPIIVTQTRHDHANGALFPIGNVPLNSYSASALEGVGGIEALLSFPAEKRTSRQPAWRRFITDVARIPAGIVWSAIALPLNYLWAQLNELRDRKLNYNYIPDTLAQLPAVEVLVKPWGHDWGKEYKGAFNLGAINESAARLSTRALFKQAKAEKSYPVRCLSDLTDDNKWQFPNSNPRIFLDVSSVMSRSMWGPDLEQPAIDFTVGWLDPKGSHTQFTDELAESAKPNAGPVEHPQLLDVIFNVLKGRVVPADPDAAASGAPSSGNECRA